MMRSFDWTPKVCLLAVGFIASIVPSADASVFFFQNNQAAFEAMLGGKPGSHVNFDSLAPGTNINGVNIGGVTMTSLNLASPGTNTLEIVTGASTFTPTTGWAPGKGPNNASTNVLAPIVGQNVLSPGGAALVPGPNTAEQDGIEITFNTPQSAFSIHLLFQSFDSSSNMSYHFYNQFNTLIGQGSINLPPGITAGGPAGAWHFGFISDNVLQNVARIQFREADSDNNFPDSNIGYDNLRFGQPNLMPEPSTALLWMLGSGALALSRRRR